jgi:FkbM family methyltransferase
MGHIKEEIQRKLKYTSTYLQVTISKSNYVNCRGVNLCIDKNKFTEKVIHSFYTENYEQDEKNVLESTLSPSDRYLEIGAGVGYMGIIAASIIENSDQVFLFEANPAMIDIIKTNMELNGLNVPVFNKAVISGDDEKITFYLAKDFWVSSTLHKKDTKKIAIDALSLENVLKLYNPTYLMVDVEGGEYGLLTHSEMSKSVRKICLEIHSQFISSEKITAIFKVLLNEGFTIDFNLSENHVYYMYR